MAVIEHKYFDKNGLNWVVRNILPQDRDELLEVIYKINSETPYMLREPGEFRDTVGRDTEFISKRLEAERELFIAAEVDGNIAGILNFTGSNLKRIRHRGVFWTGVLKEYWGKSIGSSMLHSLMDWADSAGIMRIMLDVVTTNESAINLYKKFGFEVEGMLKKDHYLGDGIYLDLYLMARVLQ